ncbi:MAG: hypothetical protein M1343_14460 [Chloroflexi bacterium]|nr:hypothetical protein [Chloroflexota bacterium]MDA8189628.1 hypothetical protein [Dehalococcoidales bacterium]
MARLVVDIPTQRVKEKINVARPDISFGLCQVVLFSKLVNKLGDLDAGFVRRWCQLVSYGSLLQT